MRTLFSNFRLFSLLALAMALGAVDRDASFQQTNLFSAKIDGSIRMQGNVLVFPTN